MPSRTRLFLNAEAILYIVILINMQRAFLPLPVSPLLCLASIFLCFIIMYNNIYAFYPFCDKLIEKNSF